MVPDTWRDVAAAAAVRPGSPVVVDVEDVPVALVRLPDGRLFALQNVCPHMGGPVGEGAVAGTIVTCPWHGWAFDLTSGGNVRNPAARLRLVAAREERGRVLLGWPPD